MSTAISTTDLVKIHELISQQARNLIVVKGAKYCGAEQDKGNTLASRVLPFQVGIGTSPASYSLGRALEKIYRLITMIEKNLEDDAESIEDSTKDIQNDIIYAYVLHRLHRGDKPLKIMNLLSVGVAQGEVQATKMNIEETFDEREAI